MLAVRLGHDAIVLSALGCGAYGNPPIDVAAAFHDVITQEYSPPTGQTATGQASTSAKGDQDRHRRTAPWLGYRHISIAIINDANAYGKHNPQGNLQPFQARFPSSVSPD